MATQCAPADAPRSRYFRSAASGQWPLAAVGLLVTLQAWLVFNRPLHWGIRANADASRENYIGINGLIWIAGREIPAGQPAKSSEFLVPGPYTVFGGPILFDGIRHETGDIFTVERGEHLYSPASSTDARIVWGRNPQLPQAGTVPLLIWPKS